MQCIIIDVNETKDHIICKTKVYKDKNKEVTDREKMITNMILNDIRNIQNKIKHLISQAEADQVIDFILGCFED